MSPEPKFFEKLPSCLVGKEACGSAHHWARELTEIGHDVRTAHACGLCQTVCHAPARACGEAKLARAELRVEFIVDAAYD